jgi:hypothetical protein
MSELKKLVEKWREWSVGNKGTESAKFAVGHCADELEAALLAPQSAPTRKKGHSALRWNKDKQKLETFDAHPPAEPAPLQIPEGHKIPVIATDGGRVEMKPFLDEPAPNASSGPSIIRKDGSSVASDIANATFDD